MLLTVDKLTDEMWTLDRFMQQRRQWQQQQQQQQWNPPHDPDGVPGLDEVDEEDGSADADADADAADDPDSANVADSDAVVVLLEVVSLVAGVACGFSSSCVSSLQS